MSTPDDDALASELVTEALLGYEQLFTPDMLVLLRAMLESELVATTAGKRMLRACQPDPTVDRSGDLAKQGLPPVKSAKASGDE